MATDLNRVSLIGRLTKDPELKQLAGGTSVCRLSLANNRTYKTNGEQREEVGFYNCIAWGKAGEILAQYVKKGKQIAIDGRLSQHSWEGIDGKKVSSVEIVIENFQFLGGPADGQSGNRKQEPPSPVDMPPNEFPDDDIPF